MKKFVFLMSLLLFHFVISAQVRGTVTDSISGLPIPYVSIWVENENAATTAEENGSFSIKVTGNGKKLVFSAMGYARKTIAATHANSVLLSPTAFALDEVVISKRYETRRKEIGMPESQVWETFESAPRIDIKYFPYLPMYQKTKFLKQLSIITDSKIEDASFKIHLYSVDENGYPGQELLEKDFIVSVGKGVSNTKFNLTPLNLRMPQHGLFVGFEKLMIEKNRIEKITTDVDTKKQQIRVSHYPFLLYYYVESDFQFVFVNGQWIKKTNLDNGAAAGKMKIYEPAITLVLSN